MVSVMNFVYNIDNILCVLVVLIRSEVCKEDLYVDMSKVEGSYLVIVEVEVDELGKLVNTVVKVIIGMSDCDGSNVLVVIGECKSVDFVVSDVLVKVEGLNAGLVESEVVLIEPEYEGLKVVLITAEVDELVNMFDKDVSVVLDKAEVVIVVKVKDECILDDTITVVSIELGEFEAVDSIEVEADE